MSSTIFMSFLRCTAGGSCVSLVQRPQVGFCCGTGRGSRKENEINHTSRPKKLYHSSPEAASPSSWIPEVVQFCYLSTWAWEHGRGNQMVQAAVQAAAQPKGLISSMGLGSGVWAWAWASAAQVHRPCCHWIREASMVINSFRDGDSETSCGVRDSRLTARSL